MINKWMPLPRDELLFGVAFHAASASARGDDHGKIIILHN